MNQRSHPPLTPEEQEYLDQELADLFVHEAPNVAASLGIDWAKTLTPEEERINAEFDRLYRPSPTD